MPIVHTDCPDMSKAYVTDWATSPAVQSLGKNKCKPKVVHFWISRFSETHLPKSNQKFPRYDMKCSGKHDFN